jgi:RND family efflux transporter MFP subunit
LLPWCAAFLLLVAPACTSSDDGDSRRGPRGGRGGAGSTPSVEAVQARYGALPLEERMSGTVRAMNQVAIYPEIDAPVVEVIADNGDYVEKGDPLVRLRDDVYRQRVRQSEANLQMAKAEAQSAQASLQELQAQLKRTRRLAEKQYESEQRLETLKAQVASAKADLNRAEANVEQVRATLAERRTDLRRTVVRAPFNGYVGNRTVDLGQRVDGSTQIYTMGALDTVKVRIQVTDKMFGQIQTGQTTRITAPALGDTLVTAEVARMSPFINDQTYSAEAVIEIPNSGGLFKPGMFVKVDVLYGESQQATLVPLSALYEDPTTGTRGVFVAPTLGTEIPIETPESYSVDDPPPLTPPTPTVFREVDIVAEGQQTAGIRGVEPGDWVVTVGQNLLSTSADERVEARVRPMPWSRLLALQRLQDTDLLQRILERQQRLAEQRFGGQDTTQADTASAAPDSASATAALSERP